VRCDWRPQAQLHRTFHARNFSSCDHAGELHPPFSSIQYARNASCRSTLCNLFDMQAGPKRMSHLALPAHPAAAFRLPPTTQPHRARTSLLLSAAGRLVRRQSSFCGPHHLQPAQARALASFPSPYNTHRPCNNTEPRYGSPLGGRVSSPLTLHWESWELQEFGIYPRAQKEAAAMRRAPFFDAFCYGFFSFGSS